MIDRGRTDACRGHPCDNCATCRRGRCCRRDNPNYRLPELGAWEGPIYGELGVLNDDGTMQECHCCGEWFVALGVHAYHMHDLTAREYRAIFGLRATRKLAGEELRRKQSRVNGRRLVAAQPERSALLDLTPEQRSFQARQPRRLESRGDPHVQEQRNAALHKARATQRQLRAAGKLQAPAALKDQSTALQAAYFDWLAHRHEEDERTYARAAVQVMFDTLGLADASDEQIARTVTTQTFKACGLMGLLAAVYNWSAYAALVDLYPDIRPWQMGQAPQAYWQGAMGRAHARDAMRWMIAQLGLADADPGQVSQHITLAAFGRHGLIGMLDHAYGSSVWAAVQDLFPDLEPWQRRAPQGYWIGRDGRDHARAATHWMLQQLGLAEAAPAQVAALVSGKTFAAYGLTAMLAEVYGDSVYHALVDVVLDLHPWQMRKVPQGYWVGEHAWQHAHDATRWLLQQLGLADASYDTVRARLRWQDFVDYGLRNVPRLYGTTEAALRAFYAATESPS